MHSEPVLSFPSFLVSPFLNGALNLLVVCPNFWQVVFYLKLVVKLHHLVFEIWTRRRDEFQPQSFNVFFLNLILFYRTGFGDHGKFNFACSTNRYFEDWVEYQMVELQLVDSCETRVTDLAASATFF